jgi:hypothetical protein
MGISGLKGGGGNSKNENGRKPLRKRTEIRKKESQSNRREDKASKNPIFTLHALWPPRRKVHFFLGGGGGWVWYQTVLYTVHDFLTCLKTNSTVK